MHPSGSETKVAEELRAEAMTAHDEMMADLLAEANDD